MSALPGVRELQTQVGYRLRANVEPWDVDVDFVSPATIFAEIGDWVLEFDLERPSDGTTFASLCQAVARRRLVAKRRKRWWGLAAQETLTDGERTYAQRIVSS